MKIWIIGRSYPEKSNRMYGSFELEQAKMLEKNGHEVSYLTCVFHPFRKVRKWGFCDWIEDGIHIFAYSCPYFPNRFHVYMNNFQLKVWVKLLSHVEERTGTPDVIHVHYPTLLTQPEAVLSYKSKGTIIVATEHWTAVQTEQINNHELNQLKKYVSEADKFICVGKPLEEKIHKLTKTERRLYIVPNVVPNFFKCKEKDWSGFRFVAVGRLVSAKQFDRLVEAFWKVYSGEKSVTLTIVGGGDEYRRLKNQIKRLGSTGQIKLTGTLSRKQTAEIISNSNALVCYSRLETFGVPIIEAWYCGIPVIASDAIGFAEYFDESVGLLISKNDDEILKESLLKMKKDYKKYSTDHIHSFAEKNFSEAAVYEKLMRVYSE